MTVHDRLRQKIKQRGYTLRGFAALVNISPASVQRYAAGTTPIPLDRLEIMAKALLTTPAYLMGYEEEMPGNIMPITTKKIPVLGNIAAGTPIQANEEIETYIEASNDVRCDYALIVTGDSMHPTIQKGDLVFIRQQADVNDGQIAAVLIDDTATLKRVYHIPNGLQLVSDNTTKYSPMMVTMPEHDTVAILGLAVAFKRII